MYMNRLNYNLAELVGVIIGDGSILYNKEKRIYRLEIAGNATEDIEYFNKLKEIINKISLSKNRAKIRFRKHKLGKSITLYINNKNFIKYLIQKLKLPSGKKTFSIKIPQKFLNWNVSKHILRGIFESDGSIYFSKSKLIKYPNYPRIEIKTSSKNLKKQIVKLLEQNNFKVQTLDSNSDKTTKIYISGDIMLNKWVKEIGVSSIKNQSKIALFKKLGYYMPKSTLEDRRKILKGHINQYL